MVPQIIQSSWMTITCGNHWDPGPPSPSIQRDWFKVSKTSVFFRIGHGHSLAIDGHVPHLPLEKQEINSIFIFFICRFPWKPLLLDIVPAFFICQLVPLATFRWRLAESFFSDVFSGMVWVLRIRLGGSSNLRHPKQVDEHLNLVQNGLFCPLFIPYQYWCVVVFPTCFNKAIWSSLI